MRQERTIYALIDPQGKPFYVGQSRTPKARFSAHKSAGRFGARAHELRPLEIVSDPHEAAQRETHWIGEFLRQGFALENKQVQGQILRAWPKFICLETLETFANINDLAERLGFGPQMTKTLFRQSKYGRNLIAHNFNRWDYGKPADVLHFRRIPKYSQNYRCDRLETYEI